VLCCAVLCCAVPAPPCNPSHPTPFFSLLILPFLPPFFSGMWDNKTNQFINAIQTCTDAGTVIETFKDLLYPVKTFRCSLCSTIPEANRVILCEHCARELHIDCTLGKGVPIPRGKVYCPQCVKRKGEARLLLGGQCAPLRSTSDVIRVRKVHMF